MPCFVGILAASSSPKLAGVVDSLEKCRLTVTRSSAVELPKGANRVAGICVFPEELRYTSKVFIFVVDVAIFEGSVAPLERKYTPWRLGQFLTLIKSQYIPFSPNEYVGLPAMTKYLRLPHLSKNWDFPSGLPRTGDPWIIRVSTELILPNGFTLVHA